MHIENRSEHNKRKLMHEIHSQEMTPDFFECWKAAGMHLNAQVQEAYKAGFVLIHTLLFLSTFPSDSATRYSSSELLMLTVKLAARGT
jgi:hypothetical protein